MEATSPLYQRPLVFTSQSAVREWIHNSSPTDLQRVGNITLRLVDINISALFSRNPSQRPSAWDLYQAELESLDRTLQSIPGLLDLTIIPPEPITSHLLRAMYLSFLGLIPKRLPGLRCLTLEDSHGVAERVPGLSKLTKVVCRQPIRSCVSRSSEDEFTRIAGIASEGRRLPAEEQVRVKVEDPEC